jgi:hypothetical protein
MKTIELKELRMHLYGVKQNLKRARSSGNVAEIQRLESLRARLRSRLK